jgi:hypothetical protein
VSGGARKTASTRGWSANVAAGYGAWTAHRCRLGPPRQLAGDVGPAASPICVAAAAGGDRVPSPALGLPYPPGKIRTGFTVSPLSESSIASLTRSKG